MNKKYLKGILQPSKTVVLVHQDNPEGQSVSHSDDLFPRAYLVTYFPPHSLIPFKVGILESELKVVYNLTNSTACVITVAREYISQYHHSLISFV